MCFRLSFFLLLIMEIKLLIGYSSNIYFFFIFIFIVYYGFVYLPKIVDAFSFFSKNFQKYLSIVSVFYFYRSKKQTFVHSLISKFKLIVLLSIYKNLISYYSYMLTYFLEDTQKYLKFNLERFLLRK